MSDILKKSNVAIITWNNDTFIEDTFREYPEDMTKLFTRLKLISNSDTVNCKDLYIDAVNRLSYFNYVCVISCKHPTYFGLSPITLRNTSQILKIIRNDFYLYEDNISKDFPNSLKLKDINYRLLKRKDYKDI